MGHRKRFYCFIFTCLFFLNPQWYYWEWSCTWKHTLHSHMWSYANTHAHTHTPTHSLLSLPFFYCKLLYAFGPRLFLTRKVIWKPHLCYQASVNFPKCAPGSKSSRIFQQGSESHGGRRGLVKEVSETMHTQPVSQKAMRDFRTSKVLRPPEVKWEKTKAALIWSNVCVPEPPFSFLALLLPTPPRTNFPYPKLGWSCATRNGMGKESWLGGPRGRKWGAWGVQNTLGK